MFAPFSRFFPRRPVPSQTESAFVAEVRVTLPREPRSRRSEFVLVVGWLLIGLKSVAIWWACDHYPEIKVNAWWVIGPTVFFGALCTWLYWQRD